MIEILSYLGASTAWSFLLRTVLEDLAKDAAKDFVKDFCKDSLKHVLVDRDEWTAATARALKAFLEIFEIELIGAGETELTCETYAGALKSFTRQSKVRLALGQLITDEQAAFDSLALARLWDELLLGRLPEDFNWSRVARLYRSKSAAIKRESSELRAVLDSHHIAATDAGIRRLGGVAPGFDVALYAASLLRRYRYLRLDSLHPGTEHRNIPLTRVFIEPTVRQSRRFDMREHATTARSSSAKTQEALDAEAGKQKLDEQREQSRPAATLRPALAVLNDPANRLSVILGNPGSGKSMLLGAYAMQWAELPLEPRARQSLPLLIELKAYATSVAEGHCRDFLEFIDHGPAAAAHLDRGELDSVLESGNAVLLADGLDEVFDRAARMQIVAELVRFAVRYPQARVLVTSRIVGYELVASALENAQFQHYVLQPLDAAQREAFLQRWHLVAYDDARERASKTAQLREAIATFAAIRELATSPLLLTLMALLNRYQELPRDRNDLYEQASRIMLQNWEFAKAIGDRDDTSALSLDHNDKHALMRAIALEMQATEQGLEQNIVTDDRLKTTITAHLSLQGYSEPRAIATRLIAQLRERNFVLCLLGNDYFAFVHRTFLEFYTAWALAWKFEKERSLTFEELRRHTFVEQWHNEAWHEVLALLASRLDPKFSVPLINGLLDTVDPDGGYRNVFLAAKCYSDLRKSAVLEQLTIRLRSVLNELVRFKVSPHHFSYRLPKFDPSQTGAQALRAFVSCWPDAETSQWLREKTLDNRFQAVQQAALTELIARWGDDPETRKLLDVVVSDEPSPQLRLIAFREIVRALRGQPDGWEQLMARRRNHRWLIDDQMVIEEIANHWMRHPGSMELLVKRLQYATGERRKYILGVLAANAKPAGTASH